MTQSISISIALGATHAGLADLRAQLIDTAGVNVGAAVSTGFVVLGDASNGNYGWTGSVADDFQGFVNVYSLATPTIAATVGVNQIAIPSAATIATAVWAAGTRTLSSFGTLAADVWAYAARTLTQGTASVIAAVSGTDISVYSGTTWSISLTGLGSLTGYSKLWFTLKSSDSLPDTDALLQIEITGGLVRLNGRAYSATTDGSIVITDASAGNITITVKPAATSQLAFASDLNYDIKLLTSGGTVSLMADGVSKFNILPVTTRAIV